MGLLRFKADDQLDALTKGIRAEAEQLDHEGRYTTALPPDTFIDTCRCLRCGALVGDRATHDAWHASLGA